MWICKHLTKLIHLSVESIKEDNEDPNWLTLSMFDGSYNLRDPILSRLISENKLLDLKHINLCNVVMSVQDGIRFIASLPEDIDIYNISVVANCDLEEDEIVVVSRKVNDFLLAFAKQ